MAQASTRSSIAWRHIFDDDDRVVGFRKDDDGELYVFAFSYRLLVATVELEDALQWASTRLAFWNMAHGPSQFSQVTDSMLGHACPSRIKVVLASIYTAG